MADDVIVDGKIITAENSTRPACSVRPSPRCCRPVSRPDKVSLASSTSGQSAPPAIGRRLHQDAGAGLDGSRRAGLLARQQIFDTLALGSGALQERLELCRADLRCGEPNTT